MKPKDKCVSRELAQELWGMGWRIDCERYWCNAEVPLSFKEGYKYGYDPTAPKTDLGWHIRDKEDVDHLHKLPTISNVEAYPAPDASEIMDVLPEIIDLGIGVDDKIYGFECSKHSGDVYTVTYLHRGERVTVLKHLGANTLVNALAKMLVYLTKEALSFAVDAVGKVDGLKETIRMMKAGNEQDVLRLQEVEEENKALRQNLKNSQDDFDKLTKEVSNLRKELAEIYDQRKQG